MLSTGHAAASIILAKSAHLMGYDLDWLEMLLIVAAGSIVDVDFIAGYLFGKKGEDHHNFVSHTPLGCLILWGLYMLISGYGLSMILNILVLISLLIHLILDDLGYWFCRLGIQEISRNRQINWLYPLRKFSKSERKVSYNIELLKNYLTKAKANVVLELALMTAAFIVLL